MLERSQIVNGDLFNASPPRAGDVDQLTPIIGDPRVGGSDVANAFEKAPDQPIAVHCNEDHSSASFSSSLTIGDLRNKFLEVLVPPRPLCRQKWLGMTLPACSPSRTSLGRDCPLGIFGRSKSTFW